MIWLGRDNFKWCIEVLNEEKGDDLVWEGDFGE